MKQKVEDIIYEIVKPITDEKGFELVEVEYKKEGADWYLRVFIDKEGGIDINDCKVISEVVNPILDELDPISDAYFFEVSSPGIERPLKNDKDFMKNMGKLIQIKFYKPYDGKKTIDGILEKYTDATVTIMAGKEKMTINRDLISIIKPVIIF